ncbi:MAG TPA: MarR family transcriptional regulator [Thermotogae bacterium]|nr:MarR family transcriptional regulator [Thermotogota bacterium]
MFIEAGKILEMIFDLVMIFSRSMPFVPEAVEMNTLEFYVFMFVALKGPSSMSEIARKLAVSKSNVTAVVDRLEAKGYLKRVRSASDRRVVHVVLTERGERLYQDILGNLEDTIQTAVSRIPPEDLKVISDGFERMIRVFLSGEVEE